MTLLFSLLELAVLVGIGYLIYRAVWPQIHLEIILAMLTMQEFFGLC